MKHTAEWGANLERTAILAKVRKMRKIAIGTAIDSDSLITWLLQRNERYNKRKGGLGK